MNLKLKVVHICFLQILDCYATFNKLGILQIFYYHYYFAQLVHSEKNGKSTFLYAWNFCCSVYYIMLIIMKNLHKMLGI